jgi:hypothetical protein
VSLPEPSHEHNDTTPPSTTNGDDIRFPAAYITNKEFRRSGVFRTWQGRDTTGRSALCRGKCATGQSEVFFLAPHVLAYMTRHASKIRHFKHDYGILTALFLTRLTTGVLGLAVLFLVSMVIVDDTHGSLEL